ncbi:MAG: hypothetical protein ABL952_11490 [Pyrinomonadaceae bacterium]
MNDKTRRYVECGQRCRQWIVDFVALIPGGSLFETKTALLTAIVNEIENLAGAVASFVGEGLSATDVKGSERIDLLDIMAKVRNAARAAEFDNPGTRDRYRYTTTMADQALLAAGRSFALGEPDDGSLLTSYGAPSHWWSLVTDACNAFEASFGQQDSALGGRVAKNAEINAKLNDFVALKSTISHMVPNFCASEPGAIAAWNSAAHIEEAPKKKPTPPTP